MTREHLVIGDGVVFDGGGILGRVGGVDAVDVLGQQDGVGAYLRRAQDCAGVGREEGVAGAAAKDDDAALLQMPDGLGADVGLGDLVHGDGRLYPDLHAALLEAVSHGQGVDDGREHAHMVRARALHLAAAVFDAAPEVAAADHDADLHAGLDALLDHVAHAADDREIQSPVRVARQRLSADLE